MSFADRVTKLPHLGLGVSTEHGAGDAARALAVLALGPAFAAFLEFAADGCTRATLLVETRRHGTELGEDSEIVARLIVDGLLR
jgi:hypothetical protein